LKITLFIMTKQILWLAVFLCVLFFTMRAILAQPLAYNSGPGFAGYSLAAPTTTPSQATTSPPKFILLNNGQVVHGEILSSAETVQIRSERGIISIPRNDIALIAATLQEVYQFQKASVPQTSDASLKLADWCVANKLNNEAALEFDRAILLAGHPQLAEAIRSRKNAALSMVDERQLQSQMKEMETQKYKQWKQKVPPATFATFKREILPMLVQNCSGIACHSGNSINEFRFVANPHNSDVDVARNLHVVLGYITPDKAIESRLLLVPIAPHGRTKEIFTWRNSGAYEKLCLWTDQVAKDMHSYYPLDASDRITTPRDSVNSMTIQQASGNMIPFPALGEELVESPIPSNSTAQKQPSSLAQGLIQTSKPPAVPPAYRPPAQQSDFNFFTQPSIVVPGMERGGLPRPVPAGMQQKPNTVFTRNSTDAFEQNSTLQQLQRDPVDPFDPVLFNRQYHYQRIEKDRTVR
jgi:hypothetical protein